MSKLPNLGIGIRNGEPVTDEAEHFIACPECGQPIDCRDLAQVFHHNAPGHGPLPETEVMRVMRGRHRN